ncbi:rhodanese-like domain-containing protein [Nodosilinea sp. LEGE 07088]|uniref:rhodanese-like domain-containing protein n=1 Tax=Nodosilinea sp. LEGE 07088 TaxID=2777968 RepID=UPI00187F6E4C|nr:rhodanese-like domain-containing protein [Nodosilinea sp. LEGE 07088]MBE9139740.1 rhodanese-like domain-containing protein [Nodosilinea sp. LEGE 07088]
MRLIALVCLLMVIGGLIVIAAQPSRLADSPLTPTLVATNPYGVTPREAQALIAAHRHDPDFVILDVRTPPEFATAHLAGAINLDFHSPTFQADLAQLDRQKTYLVYCQRGIRSDRARAVMVNLNFRQLYDLLGGLSRWQREGLPL